MLNYAVIQKILSKLNYRKFIQIFIILFFFTFKLLNVYFFSDVNKLEIVLDEMVDGIIEEFLKPYENLLIFRNNQLLTKKINNKLCSI